MALSKAKKEREKFLDGMARLIKHYELWFELAGEESVLPEGYKPNENEVVENGVPSLGQMVAILNDNLHGTRYGNKWTRHSLKLLIDELKEKGVKINVGHGDNKTSRANSARSRKADEFAMGVYEKYLRHLDIEGMTNSEVSRQLNEMESKTIRGNDWSPAGCGKLLERLNEVGILK